jgi:hypothetical protein
MSKNIEHKKEFKQFVINESDEHYRIILGDLYSSWDKYNNEFFKSEFNTPPYITLSAPRYMGHLGAYKTISDFGGRSHIKIRHALLGDGHPRTKNMTDKGKQRFVRDVLLHQMVHQYLDEILGLDPKLVQLHTGVFITKCNEIGEKLNLVSVGPPNQPKSGPKLPSAIYWPNIVRPYGYYGGEYEPRKKSKDRLNALVRKFKSLSPKNKLDYFERLTKLYGKPFLMGLMTGSSATRAVILERNQKEDKHQPSMSPY